MLPAVNPLSRFSSLMIGMIGVMVRPREAAAEAVAHPRDFDAWIQAEQRRVFLLCYRLLGERDEAAKDRDGLAVERDAEQAAELATRFDWLREFAICTRHIDESLWRYRYFGGEDPLPGDRPGHHHRRRAGRRYRV